MATSTMKYTSSSQAPYILSPPSLMQPIETKTCHLFGAERPHEICRLVVGPTTMVDIARAFREASILCFVKLGLVLPPMEERKTPDFVWRVRL